MTIVSVSIPEEMVDEMDTIQKSMGFSGRSELIRAAVRGLIADNREKNGISGEVNAVIVATHDQSNEEAVTRLKHSFEDIVKTHLHNKLSRRSCAELFLVQGDGSKIASMASAFQKDEGMRSVKLVIV